MMPQERLDSEAEHAKVWAEESREERPRLAAVLPKSVLGKAAGYTLNMWPKLRRLRLRGSGVID